MDERVLPTITARFVTKVILLRRIGGRVLWEGLGDAIFIYIPWGKGDCVIVFTLTYIHYNLFLLTILIDLTAVQSKMYICKDDIYGVQRKYSHENAEKDFVSKSNPLLS